MRVSVCVCREDPARQHARLFQSPRIGKGKGRTKTQGQQHPQRVDGGSACRWGGWGGRWAALTPRGCSARPHNVLSVGPGGSKEPNTVGKAVPRSPPPHTLPGHAEPQRLLFVSSLHAEATNVGTFRMSHLDAASLSGKEDQHNGAANTREQSCAQQHLKAPFGTGGSDGQGSTLVTRPP